MAPYRRLLSAVAEPTSRASSSTRVKSDLKAIQLGQKLADALAFGSDMRMGECDHVDIARQPYRWSHSRRGF